MPHITGYNSFLESHTRNRFCRDICTYIRSFCFNRANGEESASNGHLGHLVHALGRKNEKHVGESLVVSNCSRFLDIIKIAA